MKERAPLANRKQYRRLVEKLIYISCTKPDIAYAIIVVCLLIHQPQETLIEIVIRIIPYLKDTPSRGIMFERNGSLNIEVFTDADWVKKIQTIGDPL